METQINKIAGYRAMLGLTQQQMGERLGIKNKQTYSLKENGKRAFSDKEKELLKKIMLPYFPDITIDDIFFEN
ncbi:transcriptional regulator [Aerococcus viridans]